MSNFILVILFSLDLLTAKGMLHEMAVAQNIDPTLAHCIVTNESNWDASLVSRDNDTGLFQIIPSTGEWVAQQMGLTSYDLKDPVTNMQMGLWILKRYPEWYSTLYLCK